MKDVFGIHTEGRAEFIDNNIEILFIPLAEGNFSEHETCVADDLEDQLIVLDCCSGASRGGDGELRVTR